MLEDIKGGLKLNNHMWSGDDNSYSIGSILTFTITLPIFLIGYLAQKLFKLLGKRINY